MEYALVYVMKSSSLEAFYCQPHWTPGQKLDQGRSEELANSACPVSCLLCYWFAEKKIDNLRCSEKELN